MATMESLNVLRKLGRSVTENVDRRLSNFRLPVTLAVQRLKVRLYFATAFWLNVVNAELSPQRYWRGPRSQEVDEKGDAA